MPKKKCGLFVEFRDKRIVDEKGREVSIIEARRRWNEGLVANFDLAFHRLVRCGWDFHELALEFRRIDAARGK